MKEESIMFTTVTMSAYQYKLKLDSQKYVIYLNFYIYITSVIVTKFPRPKTRHWIKQTVIGCLTHLSNALANESCPLYQTFSHQSG